MLFQNNFLLQGSQLEIMQEVTLVNNGTDPWPSDSRLHLFDSVTDIPVAEDIFIGAQVPVGVSVKIKMKIDAR